MKESDKIKRRTLLKDISSSDFEGVKISKRTFITSFLCKDKRATLSRNLLEVNTLVEQLKPQMKMYKKSKIESCHLGRMKGYINIKSNEHLKEILNIYFNDCIKQVRINENLRRIS